MSGKSVAELVEEKVLDSGTGQVFQFDGKPLRFHRHQEEAIALAKHIKHLEKTHWQSKLSLSVPRLRPFAGCYTPKHPISDKDFLKFMLAMRIMFPDLGMSLSTRESSVLRDHLSHLCITQMSAESKTEPGGYSGKKALKQFEISDSRSLTSICKLLEDKGLEPIFKDWDRAFH